MCSELERHCSVNPSPWRQISEVDGECMVGGLVKHEWVLNGRKIVRIVDD